MSASLRRALLYVPGSSSRMLERSRSLKVDCVTYDLEDSVTTALKPLARANVRRLLDLPRASGIREQAVRINALKTGLAEDDLNAVITSPQLDSIVIPKVQSDSDIAYVADMLKHHSRVNVKIIALIESARAVMDIREICRSPSSKEFLSGLIFAAEDFALDVGLHRTKSLTEMLFARQSIVTAAVAFEIPSIIDLVCTDYKDVSEEGPLVQECKDGANMGFTGKQVIHPSQVDVVQRMFSPSEKKISWALRVLIANERAVDEGRGAWTLDGMMIDAPVIGAAKKWATKAELAGMDVQALRERYRDVRPDNS